MSFFSTYVYVGGFDKGALRMNMVIQNHQPNHHPQHKQLGLLPLELRYQLPAREDFCSNINLGIKAKGDLRAF